MRSALAGFVGLAAVAVVGCGQDEPFFVSAPPSFDGVIRVELHASQPQVVDVVTTVRDGAQVSVEVPSDQGVRSERVITEGGEVRVRVRGLIPSTLYDATLVIRGDQGGEERAPMSFKTLEARVGFIAQFQTENLAGSPDYRLFDLSSTPDIADGGIFVVDRDGITRFHLPAPSTSPPNLPFRPPAGLKLLPDGTIAFLQDAELRVVDELGRLVRQVHATDVGDAGFHHDVITLPNGNFMVVGLEFDTFTLQADGNDYYYAGDTLTELTPAGQKVWGWSSFEHLDVQRVLPDFLAAEYINPENDQAGKDWTHGNGIIYREADDSVLFSLRHQDWMIKIDRDSGEVEWRLGEGGDFTLETGSWFYHPHSPEWQPDGSLLLYDNGIGNPQIPFPEQTSRPVRYTIDETTMTVKQVWEDTQETYMSAIAGDADRTSTGTYLILDSARPVPGGDPAALDIYSRLREVDPETGEWLWTLRTLDRYFVYRAVPLTRLPGEAAPDD